MVWAVQILNVEPETPTRQDDTIEGFLRFGNPPESVDESKIRDFTVNSEMGWAVNAGCIGGSVVV
jgi:hypothetical protein